MTRENERDIYSRIDNIRKQITSIDLACPGTLLKRKKKCGNPNCRCASDPNALHGPYFEWNRREGGRLVHKIVSPEQAKEIEKAIKNYRTIEGLMKQWGRETGSIILGNK